MQFRIPYIWKCGEYFELNADMYMSGKFEPFHDLEICYLALPASYYMTFLLCMDEDTLQMKVQQFDCT